MAEKTITEQIQEEFGKFKEANELSRDEIKKYGVESQETKNMVIKANDAITALQLKLDDERREDRERIAELENRANRPTSGPLDHHKMDEKKLQHYASWQNRHFSGPAVEDLAHVNLEKLQAYDKAFAAYARKGDDSGLLQFRNDLSVASDPSIGYWVSPAISGRTVEFMHEVSPVRQFANVESYTEGDAVEGDYDLDLAGASWVGETEARSTTTTPGIGSWKIPFQEQYANPRATQRSLDMSGRDIEGWLSRKIGQAFGLGEGTAFVTGDGVKRPRGFTTYGAGTPAYTSTALYQVIRQIASGASGGLTADGVLNLTILGLKKGMRNGAMLGMNRTTEAALRIIKQGDGGYYFQQDVNGRFQPMLDGYPIEEFPDMPDIAANAEPIFFGNLREAYTIVDLLGLRVLRDPYTDKPYVHFYTTRYVGGDVVNFEALALQTISAS